MNRKINLFLAAFLLGGIATVLPLLLKIILFTGIALRQFMVYDEFSYSWDIRRRVGGAK
ncbi:hypothetical protein [Enterococcus sp. AZ196]|uniref:hypothetical protein n=1 Tax=Enterococcus sp. AZ196 TaxID=2774659 RepID=UPI003D2E618B